MAITLLDNSNTLFNSYLKGWELALKTFEEEAGQQMRKISKKNHRAV